MGTTTVPGPDGKLIAREVHVFPADRPIPNEGHRPWDLEPNSNMTNAAVSAVAASGNGRELTLTYKGGAGNVFDLLREVLQYIPVRRGTSDAGLGLQQSNSANATDSGLEVVHVDLADFPLVRQAF